jgi:glycosyltransferase involved in cell wall biosynthesis
MYYAAKALVNRGFCVTIASPSGNNDTITEVVADNINVWICPSLPYIEKTELDWIKNFDCIWCNSLQTMLCVDRISKYKPVIWWLHEHGGQYKNILGQYSAEVQDKMFTHVKILSVSDIAKKNILKYYPDLNVKNFVFGLPDFYEREKHEHSKIVFAVIGNISELKNQLEMINAIELLPEVYREKIECWIIGRDCSKKYRCDFENVVSNLNYVKICGEMTREQIEKIFSDIDVVVCTSIEETMSITIVEGMMNKKICITNSNTGIAAFISDGVNGFVYQNQNPFQLSKKIKYIVDEFSNLDCMRERARETYENNFSFERYCQNILDVMNI